MKLGRTFLIGKKMKKKDKRIFKKSPEELQEFLAFRRRGSKVASKKGKGSYKRKSRRKDWDSELCA